MVGDGLTWIGFCVRVVGIVLCVSGWALLGGVVAYFVRGWVGWWMLSKVCPVVSLRYKSFDRALPPHGPHRHTQHAHAQKPNA